MDSGCNNSAVSIFNSKPIWPLAITLLTRHKALQTLMHQWVNLDTCATLQLVNKVPLVTVKENDFLDEQQWAAINHFSITQYSFR